MIAVKVLLCALFGRQVSMAFKLGKIFKSINAAAISMPKAELKWKDLSTSASIVLLTASVSMGFPFSSLAATDLKVYKNERYHTTISYPSNWEEKSGLLSSDRPLVAFVDPSDPDTSISLAFSPIAADFTHLTSFGGKDNLKSVMIILILNSYS